MAILPTLYKSLMAESELFPRLHILDSCSQSGRLFTFDPSVKKCDFEARMVYKECSRQTRTA